MTVFLLALATAASAHDVATGPNGGRAVDVGSHHIELVVKDRAVAVFVTDAAHKPVAIAGFKGVAVLTAGGKARRIVLAPQDGARLTGVASAALPGVAKGVVQVTLPDGTILQGQFR